MTSTAEFKAPNLKREYQCHVEFSVKIDGVEREIEACFPGRHNDSDFDFYLYGEGVELVREVASSEISSEDLEMIDKAFDTMEQGKVDDMAGMDENRRFSEWKEINRRPSLFGDVTKHPRYATATDIFAD